MKIHISKQYIERCYFCPSMRVNRDVGPDFMRTFICMKLEKIIDKVPLTMTNGKYKKAGIIFQAGWFPDWCPLEDVDNNEKE